jgi:hypothetical protein
MVASLALMLASFALMVRGFGAYGPRLWRSWSRPNKMTLRKQPVLLPFHAQRALILQENIRWKALDEIYKICMLLHRSDLNISANFVDLVKLSSTLGS